MDITKRFKKYDNEYLKFDKVKPKRSSRPNLNAFMLLNGLFPGKYDIVSASEHDIIYLGIDKNDIKKLSDDNIIELLRCGVSYSDEYECLYSTHS